MILLVSEKFFKKHKKLLVKYKDFAIGDATDRDGSKYEQYNNSAEMREFNATPKLIKIARDPKSEDAKVYSRYLAKYLDSWLGDEALKQRIVGLADYIVAHFKETGEDVNIVLVLRKEVYKAYAKKLRDRINEILECTIAACLDSKMEKEDIKDILQARFKKKKLKKLAARVEKLKKKYRR